MPADQKSERPAEVALIENEGGRRLEERIGSDRRLRLAPDRKPELAGRHCR
ncbi:hypothetical protein [Bradyrhizobium brasilense]|uniref:hypothetical protein n=1 Tax=Bradyrhizobium brasilense TaxID=1419277 RepID=UPI0030B88556